MSKYFAWSDSHLAIMDGHVAHFITTGPLHAAAVIAMRGEDILCMWMVHPDPRGRFTIRYQSGFKKVTSFIVLFEAPGAGTMTRYGDPVGADIAAQDVLNVYSQADVNRAMRMGLAPSGESGGALRPRVKPEWTGPDDWGFGPLRWCNARVCSVVGSGHTVKFSWDYDIVPRYILGYTGDTISTVWVMDYVPEYKGHLSSRRDWAEFDRLDVLYHRAEPGEGQRVRKRSYWYGRDVEVTSAPVWWLEDRVKRD